MKKKGKCMPGFPAHQGAFFSAVENTLFLKWERNKEGPNCWVCPILTGQEVWEGMRFRLLMVWWEIILQRPTPCWSSESPANPSAIASTLGNGEERSRGLGQCWRKQERTAGWHKWDRLVHDPHPAPLRRTVPARSSQQLPNSFIPEAAGEAQGFNSSIAIYMNFARESRFGHICALVVPALALSILPLLLPAIWW